MDIREYDSTDYKDGSKYLLKEFSIKVRDIIVIEEDIPGNNTEDYIIGAVDMEDKGNVFIMHLTTDQIKQLNRNLTKILNRELK